MKWNFKSKLQVTLGTPYFAIMLVQSYKQLALRWMNRSPASLKPVLLTVHCALFSLGTVFYLKTCLAVWDCSENMDGKRYLDAQPAVLCEDLERSDYDKPLAEWSNYQQYIVMSVVGMAFYFVALVTVLSGVFGVRLCACGSDDGHKKRKAGDRTRLKGAVRCLGGCLMLDMEKGRQQFAFFASKSRSDYYCELRSSSQCCLLACSVC